MVSDAARAVVARLDGPAIGQGVADPGLLAVDADQRHGDDDARAAAVLEGDFVDYLVAALIVVDESGVGELPDEGKLIFVGGLDLVVAIVGLEVCLERPDPVVIDADARYLALARHCPSMCQM